MKKAIRVAIIIHGYFPQIGGAERVLMALGPPLRSKGIELHILTRHSPGLPYFETIKGVPVSRLPSSGPKVIASLTFTLTAVRKLMQLRPDLVHAHIMFSPATIAAIAKMLFKIPMVVTVHRSGPAPFGEIARLKQKFLGEYRLRIFKKLTDRFVVISQEIDQEMEAACIPASKRALIPNGIDTNYFFPLASDGKHEIRKELGLPDVPIAVFTGRLSQEKRVDLLLSIWDEIRQKISEALLLVVGNGPEYATLQEMSSDGIVFVGAVADVRPYLQASDIFVLPSIAEGLSISQLEAMSTALPVIVTNLAGAPDIIKHKHNGWLIEPNDSKALHLALLTLLNDKDRRTNLGQKARETVKEKYGIDIIAAQMCDLFETLVSRE